MEFGPIVTAEIGLRAGDEMAATGRWVAHRRDFGDAWSVIRWAGGHSV